MLNEKDKEEILNVADEVSRHNIKHATKERDEKINQRISIIGILLFTILAIGTEYITQFEFSSGELLIIMLGINILFFNLRKVD